MGVWLYRTGLLATIAIGVTTPLQRPYIPIHIWLALFAFIFLVAGMAVNLATAACLHAPARFMLAALGMLHFGVLIFLAYLFFGKLIFDANADFFAGRRWLLPIFEWAVTALIALGTVVLTAVLAPVQ